MIKSSDVAIEKIQLDDVDEIIRLYQKFRNNWSPITELPEKLEKYPALKVLVENSIIGFAYCYSFAPDILEIANIYIDENYRSQGVGSELLKSLEEQAVKENYKALILNNSDAYEGKAESKPSSNFYLGNGYKLIAETVFTRVFFKEIK